MADLKYFASWNPYLCAKNLFGMAGTLLMLGKKRGELRVLWAKGEPARPCPHLHLHMSE